MSTNRTMVVNKEIYNKPVKPSSTEKTRISIELYLPPSDIPISMSSEFKEKNDKLFLLFNYLDAEKEKILLERDGIKLIVGTYSGKPLRIEIEGIKKEGIDTVKISSIIKLIEDKAYRMSGVSGVREITNLKLTEQMLKDNAGVIASQAISHT